jgi:hypothetical protein
MDAVIEEMEANKAGVGKSKSQIEEEEIKERLGETYKSFLRFMTQRLGRKPDAYQKIFCCFMRLGSDNEDKIVLKHQVNSSRHASFASRFSAS